MLMFPDPRGAVTCASCHSSTPLAQYCKWCCKPLAGYAPREPTEAEKARYSKHKNNSYSRKNGAHRTYNKNHDPDTLALYAEIQVFCLNNRMSLSTFANRIMNNTRFITNILNGSVLRVGTIERVRRLMAEYNS